MCIREILRQGYQSDNVLVKLKKKSAFQMVYLEMLKK